MIYDVAVIGGGPVGSIAARYAAIHGAKVALFEEHSSIGSPVGCTGLLSVKALRECDISPDPSFVVNSVRGSFVHAPNGTCVSIDGRDTRAYVVLRKIFDRKLAEMAANLGVDIFLKSHVHNLVLENGINTLFVTQGSDIAEFKAKVVIAADGPRSQISRLAGIPSSDRLLPGIQFEMKIKPQKTDFVELFPGSVAPGFFAWVVPVSEGVCRVGMAIENQDESVRNYFDKFLSVLENKYGRIAIGSMDFVIGSIPLGLPSTTVSDGVIVCGDAAGQVKPTSGGGIYPGAVCAKIAGKVAAGAALEGDNSSSRLSAYDREWRSLLEKELKMGMKAHNFAAKLSDSQWDELLNSLNKPQLLDLIEEYGDMDHPSILLKKFLNPLNSRHVAGLLKGFVKSAF
ncbi:geranylgeranyl reductase family protein [Methanohalophilus levihalophilus]|uniref:NAD(P)/FAD-dependent oxidoreductase n=1 Tax=Methanohalophilus levihalophilus TaxID=1431282 RepID=UPI001AE603B9|nr:NAD(P)/FAD-dependent oxidoreductase [Methanohalophilus levihalophilus]MBP2030526.1 geranylgeranyl reductase family protein [Methanohalophilus levihalophilus]